MVSYVLFCSFTPILNFCWKWVAYIIEPDKKRRLFYHFIHSFSVSICGEATIGCLKLGSPETFSKSERAQRTM